MFRTLGSGGPQAPPGSTKPTPFLNTPLYLWPSRRRAARCAGICRGDGGGV